MDSWMLGMASFPVTTTSMINSTEEVLRIYPFTPETTMPWIK